MSPRRAAAQLLPGPVLWLAISVLVALTFFAGRYSVQVLSRPEVAAGTAAPNLWSVKADTIGRTLTFVADISLATRPGPATEAAGMITGLRSTRAVTVRADDELFDVDLQPVVVGRGSVPAFRALAPDDRGADVAQLRRFLCDLGRLHECDFSAAYADNFGPSLTAAVKAWQTAHHRKPTGTVAAGDILWFDHLPSRVRPATATAVGTRIAAGARPFEVASRVPTVKLTASRDQAALVPTGSPVQLGRLRGVVTGTSPLSTSEDAVSLNLAGPNGRGGLCASGRDCLKLLAGRASTKAELRIATVPERSGPTVPVRAIQTAADDTTYVIKADGSRAEVHVLGVAQGVAVVDGVTDGDRIRVDAS